VQAANDSLGDSERRAIQGQLTELTKEIDDIIGTTNFNGNQLLDGTGGQAGDGKLSFQVGAESSETFDVQLDSAQTEDIGLRGGDIAANAKIYEGDFDFEGNSASVTKETNYGKSGAEFTLEFTDDGSDNTSVDVTVKDANGNTTATNTGVDLTTANSVVLDTDASSGSDNQLTLDLSGVVSGVGNTADQFEAGGTMTVLADDGTLRVGDSGEAGSAIDTIDSAINEVTDQLAGIGDAQKRLSFKGENLETSRTNLESARSGIEDADFAREQMQIAKLQILQQTGTATLAQANASSQGVLSLIG
jgi:flagellin